MSAKTIDQAPPAGDPITPQSALAQARAQARAELGLPDTAKLEELDKANAELKRLLDLNGLDERKMHNSRVRQEAEQKRCFTLGIEFEEEMCPLYRGDQELKKRLHEQHYVIARLEKELGIRQPLPSRLVS